MKKAGIESVLLGITLALAMAFVVSFALGLGIGGGERERPPATATEPAADPAPDKRGRIEVLNASGRAGLAREATARLRASGFDVVFYGNAPDNLPDSTIVIDRLGKTEIARAVAQALGIEHVITKLDSALYLDATVVIGSDWARVR